VASRSIPSLPKRGAQASRIVSTSVEAAGIGFCPRRPAPLHHCPTGKECIKSCTHGFDDGRQGDSLDWLVAH
jgi:hypothetical protein